MAPPLDGRTGVGSIGIASSVFCRDCNELSPQVNVVLIMSSWDHLGGVEPMTSSLFGIAQEDGSTRDNVAQIVTGFDSFPPPRKKVRTPLG